MLQTTASESWVRTAGKGFYWLGMAGLVAGIATEIYGFSLRIGISGWAPVTNMYETVIWVALVAAVLSFVFELIFRQTYMALAGTAVALLGTITAANVPLLDPSIRSLQPVLAKQPLADDPRVDRGLQLRGVRPGLGAGH